MKKYIYLSCILLIVCLILAFFINKSVSSNKELDVFKAETNRLELSSNMLKHSLFQTIIFSHDKIKDTIRTSKGKAPIGQLIDTNTIIFRFSKESCMPCLRRELNNLSVLEKEGIPILMIVYGFSNVEMKALLNEYKIYSRYIMLENGEQLFSFEEVSSDLFLFMLTKDLVVKHLYFPVQYEDQLSVEYVNYLISLFKKNRKNQ